jgi:hypothetical protein
MVQKKDLVFTIKSRPNGSNRDDYRDSVWGTALIANGAASFHWFGLCLKKPNPRLDFEIACVYRNAANQVATGPYVSSGNPSPPYGIDNVRNILGVSARLTGPDSDKCIISYEITMSDGTRWSAVEGEWAQNPRPTPQPAWVSRMTVSLSPIDPYSPNRKAKRRKSLPRSGRRS